MTDRGKELRGVVSRALLTRGYNAVSRYTASNRATLVGWLFLDACFWNRRLGGRVVPCCNRSLLGRWILVVLVILVIIRITKEVISISEIRLKIQYLPNVNNICFCISDVRIIKLPGFHLLTDHVFNHMGAFDVGGTLCIASGFCCANKLQYHSD